eukprot:scaffold71070_cov68-Phaeocystis_antarctica.AAC.8
MCAHLLGVQINAKAEGVLAANALDCQYVTRQPLVNGRRILVVVVVVVVVVVAVVAVVVIAAAAAAALVVVIAVVVVVVVAIVVVVVVLLLLLLLLSLFRLLGSRSRTLLALAPCWHGHARQHDRREWNLCAQAAWVVSA